jgi:hypothetical protein
MVSNKELRRLISKYNFEVLRMTSKGHILVQHPNGSSTTVASSPGPGRRVLKNVEANLRRVSSGFYLQEA